MAVKINIQSVINRALKDEKYARELRDQAIAAALDGSKSPAWEKLAANFAEGPEDLARLISAVRVPLDAADRELEGKAAHPTLTLTTLTTTTTITTTTTLPCTVTSTLTTTSTYTTTTTGLQVEES